MNVEPSASVQRAIAKRPDLLGRIRSNCTPGFESSPFSGTISLPKGNLFLMAVIPSMAVIPEDDLLRVCSLDEKEYVAMSSSSLRLAVTHLNAPVGSVLTVQELAQALRSGSVASLNKTAAAIVSYLFVELDPSLIAQCVAEAGSDLRRANSLYEESVQSHIPRVSRWEHAVEHFL